MANCMKYWVELNCLMTDLREAISDGNTEAAEEIIATCRCILNDIEENLDYGDYDEDEDY